jgi:hypothetical protein
MLVRRFRLPLMPLLLPFLPLLPSFTPPSLSLLVRHPSL